MDGSLDGGDGLDWILFFGTDQREVQLSVMTLDIKAHVHPDVSIEVDDVGRLDLLPTRSRTSRSRYGSQHHKTAGRIPTAPLPAVLSTMGNTGATPIKTLSFEAMKS
jgi:hypothetical protein